MSFNTGSSLFLSSTTPKSKTVTSTTFQVSTIDSFPLKIVKSKSQLLQQEQEEKEKLSNASVVSIPVVKNQNWCPGGGACSNEFLTNEENRLFLRDSNTNENNNNNKHEENINNSDINYNHNEVKNNFEDMDPNAFGSLGGGFGGGGGFMDMSSFASIAAKAVADANNNNKHDDEIKVGDSKVTDMVIDDDDDDDDAFAMGREPSTDHGDFELHGSNNKNVINNDDNVVVESNADDEVVEFSTEGFGGGFGDAAAAAAAAVAAATAAGFNFGNFNPSEGDEESNNNNDNNGLQQEHGQHPNGEFQGGGAFAFTSSFGMQEHDHHQQTGGNTKNSSSLQQQSTISNNFHLHHHSQTGTNDQKEIFDNVTAMSLLSCNEMSQGGSNNDDSNGGNAGANIPMAVADKTGRITLFSSEPTLRKNYATNNRLRYRVLSIIPSVVDMSDMMGDAATESTTTNPDDQRSSSKASLGSMKTPPQHPQRPSPLLSPTAEIGTLLSSAAKGSNRKTASVSPHAKKEKKGESRQHQINAGRAEYKGRLTHQAFSLEQDRGSYPQRKPVDEKVTCIVPLGPQQHQMSPHSVLYLASNDMLIKLYRLRSYRNAVLDEHSQPFTMSSSSSSSAQTSSSSGNPSVDDEINNYQRMLNAGSGDLSDVILPVRTFVSSHTTPICSLSTCADQETFLSADCFKVQWWHLDTAENPCTRGVTLYDMQPKPGEDVTEVLTSAAFHPHHTSLFLVTSSSGTCRIGDLRDPPSSERRFQLNFHGSASTFTSQWTRDPLVARALKCLHGAVFLDNTPYVVTRDYMTVALWDMRMASQSEAAPTPASPIAANSNSSAMTYAALMNNNDNEKNALGGPSSTTAFMIEQQKCLRSLVCRRSVGMDCLAPMLTKLFDSEKIFDRFPITTDTQFQGLYQQQQQKHNLNSTTTTTTVATGLYGNSILFWKDPIHDVGSEEDEIVTNGFGFCKTGKCSVSKSKNVFLYTFPGDAEKKNHESEDDDDYDESATTSEAKSLKIVKKIKIEGKQQEQENNGENDESAEPEEQGEGGVFWQPMDQNDPANEKYRVTHLSMNSREVAFCTPSRVFRLDRRRS